MNPGVVPWTIYLTRRSDFWGTIAKVEDGNGDPVQFINTELVIMPEGEPPIVWNPINGKLTITGVGQFSFNVLKEEIATYSFEAADYRWSVTYSNGKTDGEWMEGKIRVS